MFGSDTVEVGVGMALLFLFMSLIATALREAIENGMKTRASDLERGLKELLNSNTIFSLSDFYEHPLIYGLFEGSYSDKGAKLPSYIPRQSFSLAFLDLVTSASKNGQALSLKSLEAAVQVANPNPVQRVVLTMLATAEGDLAKVRKGVEDWYDATMDRVSGWYTRRTGRILFMLGFLAAAAFNVDAITVAKRLTTDKPLRAAIVAQAEKTAPSPKDDKPLSIDDAIKSFNDLDGSFRKIGFPIGWAVADNGLYPAPQFCTNDTSGGNGTVVYRCEPSLAGAVGVFFGWLITALAIMLGAPFWFDVLNKFMIVRSTIKPKEKSPDEATPDRQSSSAAPTPAGAQGATGATG